MASISRNPIVPHWRQGCSQLIVGLLRELMVGLMIITIPLALFATIPSGAAPVQRNITLRFVDFKSGKPMKNLKVTITAFNEYGEHGSVPGKTIAFRIFRKTDQGGQIIIDFDDPLPNYIRIWADLSEPVPDFSPAEILKSGSLVSYRKGDGTATPDISPRPGEVVIVNKRITTGDRMRQEIP